jgi:hypothetical protein
MRPILGVGPCGRPLTIRAHVRLDRGWRSPDRRAPHAYPALEVLHIVGIALLLGNLVLLELRVWGLGRELPVAAAGAAGAGPVAAAGFALVGASGLTMFAGQPAELLANRALRHQDGPGDAGRAERRLVPRSGQPAARWTAKRDCRPCCQWGFGWAVIICGRWIAYV